MEASAGFLRRTRGRPQVLLLAGDHTGGMWEEHGPGGQAGLESKPNSALGSRVVLGKSLPLSDFPIAPCKMGVALSLGSSQDSVITNVHGFPSQSPPQGWEGEAYSVLLALPVQLRSIFLSCSSWFCPKPRFPYLGTLGWLILYCGGSLCTVGCLAASWPHPYPGCQEHFCLP